MRILALEFSSSQRSVAVVSSPRSEEVDDSRLSLEGDTNGIRLASSSGIAVEEIIENASGNTMKPLGMVEEVLKQAGLEREQIDGVVVGLGPGSYTGVRVAIALAQGWQLALGVKLLGVTSISCIAAQAKHDGFIGKVAVLVDAQRDEFYLAVYEISPAGVREVGDLKLVSMSEARDHENAGELLIGPEVTRWFEKSRLVFPRAASLGQLALDRDNLIAVEKLEPIYLREPSFVKAPPVRVVT